MSSSFSVVLWSQSGFGNDQGIESRNSMVMLEKTCTISLIHDLSIFLCMLFSLITTWKHFIKLQFLHLNEDVEGDQIYKVNINIINLRG